jgi:hypothetical protein
LSSSHHLDPPVLASWSGRAPLQGRILRALIAFLDVNIPPCFGSLRNSLQRHNDAMRGNAAALACIAAPIMQHSRGRYCVINHGCVVAAIGRSYASHSACARHEIACKLCSLAHHGDLPIRPHAGHRAVLGIGERAEILSHTVLDQVPDVLRSLVKLSDVSLDHSPRAYAALVACGVAPTLVKVNLAYNAIADGRHATRSRTRRARPTAVSRTTRCRACSS